MRLRISVGRRQVPPSTPSSCAYGQRLPDIYTAVFRPSLRRNSELRRKLMQTSRGFGLSWMELQLEHVLPRSESIFCVHSLPSYFISSHMWIDSCSRQAEVHESMHGPSYWIWLSDVSPANAENCIETRRRCACLISSLEDPSRSLASPLRNFDGENFRHEVSFVSYQIERKYSLYSSWSFHFHGENKAHCALCRLSYSTFRT